MNIVLTTATGDRPEAFALCEKWMRRQTFWPKVKRWLVVDDGKNGPTKTTLGQEYVRREPQPDDPRTTETMNYLAIAALMNEIGTNEIMFFIEDDDYYRPDYLERMAQGIEGVDLVGEIPSRYYNVALRSYMLCDNDKHAGLCQTAIRGVVVPTWIKVLQNVRNLDNPFSDINLWKAWTGPKRFVESPLRPLCVGIKGMPGRKGIGCGHRPGPNQRPDPELEILKKWIGSEDLEVYRPFCGA